MKEFKVYAENRVGELARLTRALAERAVNIRAIASEGGSNQVFLRIVTSDVTTTEKALKAEGYRYDLSDILICEMLDRPGELAKLAGRFAKAEINVQSIYLLGQKEGKSQLALVVSDMEKAKTLVNHVVSG